jgi:hypothetical protein
VARLPTTRTDATVSVVRRSSVAALPASPN